MNDVIVRGGETGFAVQIEVGAHRLKGDEPADVGGTDTGPSPYDFLLAALGSCTSMTLRMYADRKGWPLSGVTVRLRHEKIHVRDCEECETTVGKIDRIDREIELVGDLDGEQRQRLLEIANKCPVHRTLNAEVHISSKLI
jgi:putative redox protein